MINYADENDLESVSMEFESDQNLNFKDNIEEEFLIDFHEEDRFLPKSLTTTKIRDWIESLTSSYGSKIERLDYIFCSDEYLIKINKEYLDHDDYTDIITFPYQEGKTIESDIFISLDRVMENAQMLEIKYEHELLRVLAHGLLHLIGFKDKSAEDVIKMRKAEDDAILSFDTEK
jgi:rRNA maturation RNase YbeY